MAWILTVVDAEATPPKVWAVSGVLPTQDVPAEPAPPPAEGDLPDARPVIPRIEVETPPGVCDGPPMCWRFDATEARDAAIAWLATAGYAATPVEVA